MNSIYVNPEIQTAAVKLTQIVGYRDPKLAIKHLCRYFGFQRHHVADDGYGGVRFAHLTLGTVTIMVVPASEATGVGLQLVPPAAIGGAETKSSYFTVPDIDAHYDHAVRAGAYIMTPLQPMDTGGVGYESRDIEGHVWCFGSFDPTPATFQTDTTPATSVALASVDDTPNVATPGEQIAGPTRRRTPMRAVAVGVSLAALLAVAFQSGVLDQWTGTGVRSSQATIDTRAALHRLEESVVRERGLKEAALAQVGMLEEKLRDIDAARAQSELSVADFASGLRQHIATLEGRLVDAERTTSRLSAEVADERSAKEEALQTMEELTRRLAEATKAKEEAEAALSDMQLRLANIETALKTSEATFLHASAELDILRQAKAASEQATARSEASRAEERATYDEARKELDTAIVDLTRQLAQERSARTAAKASAERLRANVSTAKKANAKAKKEVERIARAAQKAKRTTSKKVSGDPTKSKAATQIKPSASGAAKKATSAPNWQTNTVPSGSGAQERKRAVASAKASKVKEDPEIWRIPSQLWRDSAPPIP